MILAAFGNVHGRHRVHKWETVEYPAISCRAHTASLTDFGGVGDGKTLNTDAFRTAVDHLSQFQSDGGSMLYVPAGKWLTGSFNLTSHFTLYLDKDAVLLASQVIFFFFFFAFADFLILNLLSNFEMNIITIMYDAFYLFKLERLIINLLSNSIILTRLI